ncbi:peptide ABC transporter substrate-binding protein [Embleya scabrispora]|uniref:peptide ABC transporter substrate-binding protein n=1 Tax=Embleya scabrispora TaxID=159449 RepID=UPI0003A5DDAB|nr:peptide ABC transporter substrate-binding protein [Embleya scabrispora]MYS86211.1 peptide ABC transporter substrate-binding protein [Streptomyces sp. SID5474]
MIHERSDRIPSRAGKLRTPVGSALAALAVLVATGCTSGAPALAPGTAIRDVPVKQGGSLVIGAEQEPDCADWISSCAGSIWGTYLMQAQTIPQVFTVAPQGKDWVPVASDLMASTPTTAMVDGRQTITYRLNPAAVWSDGQPITSADLKYTALQIRDGKDIFTQTGYDLIDSISTPDARTAVLTLKSPYANWRQLFGAEYGVLPAHLLEGKDRNALMKNGYTFSGGPWRIASWVRGTSVTLVPNERYWGRKPHLDKVTFQFTTDTAAEFQAFASGQLDALYPTPQLDVLAQINSLGGSADMQVETRTGNLQALWMNNSAFPFDSVAVRQALAHSIDRGAIVRKLFGSLGVTAPAQSFLSPLVSAFAAEDFAVYQRDLAKVQQIMTAAGWAKNGDGIWSKDGRAAQFTIVSLAGNQSRELTEQILQSQLRQAGFKMTIKNTSAANLFGKVAPAGDFQLGLWTLTDTFPEPTLDATFGSTAIPSDANGNSGINFIRAQVPGLDSVLGRVGTEVDETSRLQASRQAERLIADTVPSLPLGAVPNILLTGKKVGGPIGINPVQGPFWNLAEWGLAK